jgi:hypothetical protein
MTAMPVEGADEFTVRVPFNEMPELPDGYDIVSMEFDADHDYYTLRRRNEES